jgi:hypothetical protein
MGLFDRIFSPAKTSSEPIESILRNLSAIQGSRQSAWDALDAGDTENGIIHLRNALTRSVIRSGYRDHIVTQQALADLVATLYGAGHKTAALRLETVLWVAEVRYCRQSGTPEVLIRQPDDDVAEHYRTYKAEIDRHVDTFWNPTK